VKGYQLHFEILLKKDTIPKSISIELVESIKILKGKKWKACNGSQQFPATTFSKQFMSCSNKLLTCQDET